MANLHTFAVTGLAYGIQQIEIGLVGVSCLLIGLTAAIFGLALAIDGCLLRWAGLLDVAGEISTAASGVVICTTGFSELAMVMIALGILGWKHTLYRLEPGL